MATIKSRSGMDILVDEIDLERLSPHTWTIKYGTHTNYALTVIDGKQVRMHRFILEVTDPNIQIDHQDRNGLNNCRNNIRICSHADNAKNRGIWGQSKYRGVYRDVNRWRAQISIHGKRVRLGSFQSEKEAAEAYNKAAIATGNKFYNLNII